MTVTTVTLFDETGAESGTLATEGSGSFRRDITLTVPVLATAIRVVREEDPGEAIETPSHPPLAKPADGSTMGEILAVLERHRIGTINDLDRVLSAKREAAAGRKCRHCGSYQTEDGTEPK